MPIAQTILDDEVCNVQDRPPESFSGAAAFSLYVRCFTLRRGGAGSQKSPTVDTVIALGKALPSNPKARLSAPPCAADG